MVGISQRWVVVFSRWRNASCSMLNSPCTPGMASTIEWSLPRVWCHFWVEMHCWVFGMLASSSVRQGSPWGWGSARVIMLVSRSSQESFL